MFLKNRKHLNCIYTKTEQQSDTGAQAALLLTQSEEPLKSKNQQGATTANQWNGEMT